MSRLACCCPSNVGVDGGAIHSSIAGRIKLHNTLPPLASNDLSVRPRLLQQNHSFAAAPFFPRTWPTTISIVFDQVRKEPRSIQNCFNRSPRQITLHRIEPLR